jgi:hypothetical protein
MKNFIVLSFAYILILGLTSCKQNSSDVREQTPLVSVKTTTVIQGEIEESIQLNGKIIYLQKNKILSPIAGFLIHSNVKLGDRVDKNGVLFEIQTKENKALESTGALNKNPGIIKVLALSDGIIDRLSVFQKGAYILEGDFLCNIIDNNEIVVQVNLPFEYNSVLKNNLKWKMILPDQTSFSGKLYKIMPGINESDQTQIVYIKPTQNTILGNRLLPENLNLIVELVLREHKNTMLVSKNAVMTNETQTEFWVMKICNQNLAVKIPIQKGIEKDNMVEIISADIRKNDLVIQDGAYSLSDSTAVTIDK